VGRDLKNYLAELNKARRLARLAARRIERHAKASLVIVCAPLLKLLKFLVQSSMTSTNY